MILLIKNMFCRSCQLVVTYELEKLGIYLTRVEIGWVEIFQPISEAQIQEFKQALLRADLELVDSGKNLLVDKIISVIAEMLNESKTPVKIKFSYYLSKKLGLDYAYMANTFSKIQGITIEQYIIHHKIEKVKQLICHEDLNLSEISVKLQYSSVAHLSSQFKKITGVTPSQYKYIGCNKH